MPPNASLVVTLGIPLVALAVGVALVLGARRARANASAVAAIVVGWSVVAAVLSLSGALAKFDARPPPLAPFFVGTLVLGVALALSGIGARLGTLPLHWLVGFHAFRLPLELVMHQAAVEGTMPAQMSYSGLNFDIVTGITAAALGLVLAKRDVPKLVVLAWNILGATLLVGIVTIAFASTPIFHAFGTRPEQLNTWVAYFPFAHIALAVMGALLGHVVLFRRLLGDDRNR